MPSRQKCPPGCGCKKHQRVFSPCQPGCTCKRHVVSDEHRQKVGVAMKSLWEDSEYREKLTASHMGHEVTEETREKISKSKRGIRPDGDPAVGVSISGGYRILTGQQGHPLAGKMGNLPEHRKVLFDEIGPGSHLCFWGCGTVLTWDSPVRATVLCVDHLDRDRLNNSVENLAPSCFLCNWNRDNSSHPEIG